MRRTIVAVLAAALVGIPAVPAFATIDQCPEGVAEVRGTQPTLAQVDAWLVAAAAEHDVPVALLRVVAYKESTWRQFAADGSPLVSGDGVCGLGLMQVTADDRPDAVDLAEDGAYNASVGAQILRAAFDTNQADTIGPVGYDADDDPDVLENWLFALCAYNGCSYPYTAGYAYALDAAKYLSDPFRYLPASFRVHVTPAGFTTPVEAYADYEFPDAYQARWTAGGGEYVFYDSATGVVERVVPIRVHRASAPPVVSYPQHALGPDGPGVTCVQCGGWRLHEGAGLSGRAHWTNTITGSVPQSQVTWSGFATAPNGRYRVDAYVPAIGSDTLGLASYKVSDGGVVTTAQLAQDWNKGTWVAIAERTFGGSTASVTMTDVSNEAGKKVVADAIRLVPVPRLTMALSGSPTGTYGVRRTLTMRLVHPDGTGMAARDVKVFGRRFGGSYAFVGTYRTGTNGIVQAFVTPSQNYEYTASFHPNPGEYLGSAAVVGGVRVYVAPRIAAALSSGSVNSGAAVTMRSSVAPGHQGHTVQYQRFYGGAWRTVKYVRLDAYSRGAWTFSMTNTATACGGYQRHQFRVLKPADHDHAAAVSPIVTLAVYRRC